MNSISYCTGCNVRNEEFHSTSLTFKKMFLIAYNNKTKQILYGHYGKPWVYMGDLTGDAG